MPFRPSQLHPLLSHTRPGAHIDLRSGPLWGLLGTSPSTPHTALLCATHCLPLTFTANPGLQGRCHDACVLAHAHTCDCLARGYTNEGRHHSPHTCPRMAPPSLTGLKFGTHKRVGCGGLLCWHLAAEQPPQLRDSEHPSRGHSWDPQLTGWLLKRVGFFSLVKHEQIRLCGREQLTPRGPTEAGAGRKSGGLMK